MRTAAAVEFFKFRRSLTAKVVTVMVVVASPCFALGMVTLARSGAIAGPSASKFAPALEGTVNGAHLLLAGQILTVVMVLSVGFASVWIFGREFVDRTVSGLYALPTSRVTMGWAKVAVIATWTVIAVTIAVAVVMAGSWIIDPGGVTAEILTAAVRAWAAGTLMGLLGIPFGYIAVVTRGYLGGVGAIIAAAAVGQILGSVGVGAWVPYVAPAMWVGAGGAEIAAQITGAHLAVAVLAGVAGAAATALAFGRVRLS
jgi:hypothetical protein